jgi:hypothetical protein
VAFLRIAFTFNRTCWAAVARRGPALALAGLLMVSAGCSGDEEGRDSRDQGSEPAADGGGPAPGFMESCDPVDDRCTGDDAVCFDFRSRGAYCTHPCTQDGQCPSPSRGCSEKGVCRAP